jgi:broad specificity phosphatase PhoE
MELGKKRVSSYNASTAGVDILSTSWGDEQSTITMKLKNKYLIIRHGESEANKQGIVASSPENSINSFGLTERGEKQIRDIIRIKKENLLRSKVIIISSDFLRARESASIIAEEIECEDIIFTPLLRERFFGEYEGMPSDSYYRVWGDDLNNINNHIKGVESTQDVRERVLSVIRECEEKYRDKTILLVSHGDPLQILLASFKGLPSNRHREVKSFTNADFRELQLEPGISISELQ